MVEEVFVVFFAVYLFKHLRITLNYYYLFDYYLVTYLIISLTYNKTNVMAVVCRIVISTFE